MKKFALLCTVCSSLIPACQWSHNCSSRTMAVYLHIIGVRGDGAHPFMSQADLVTIFPLLFIPLRVLFYFLIHLDWVLIKWRGGGGRACLTLSYTGGGGGWIPPLLTLVLNSASGVQAIVLMFGDFS